MGLENMILKKAVHVEEKQAKLNSETAVQELANAHLKKAVHVEEKQAKLNSETAVQELANAHLKNKAALKKAVKAEVVAGKDAVIEPKVRKTNHKTQAPVKPHMPKALALGALGSEIKTVAQKALHVVNRRHVAQVKRGV